MIAIEYDKITSNDKAANIGYYRNGAPLEQIMLITGLYYWQIEEIIKYIPNLN